MANVTVSADVDNLLQSNALTAATVDSTDKVIIRDTDDSDTLKTVTAQSIADLASGGATAETSIWIDAGAFLGDGTAEASSKTGTNGDVDVFLMANTEMVYAKWTPPAQWDGGTIDVDVYWTCTGATAGHKVKWNVAAQAGGNDDPWDTAFPTPTATADDDVIANGDIHIIEASTITVGGTPADGDVVFFEIERTASGATQMAQEAELLGVRVKYTNTAASGGLTQETGTDADTAMAVGKNYVVDMSGWATADRVYSLPSTASVGDQVGITIKTGDDTYTLDIQTTAASNDTINGVDHDSTPWSKLFQTGETVTFECVTADTDWIVVHDGRKPCSTRLEKTDAQTLTNAAYDQIEYKTEAWNYGMTTDVVTNYRVTVRRSGMYSIKSYTCLDDSELGFIGSDFIYARVYVDGTGANEVQWCNVGADVTSRRMAAQYQTTLELNADQYIEMFISHQTTTGADMIVNSSVPNWFEVREIF